MDALGNYFEDISNKQENLTYFEVMASLNLPVDTYMKEDIEGFLNDIDNIQTLVLNVGDVLALGSVMLPYSKSSSHRSNVALYKPLNCPFYTRTYQISLTKEFFVKNQLLFNDITIHFQRDYKINQILN